MKTTRRLMAMFLALALLVAMAVPTFALSTEMTYTTKNGYVTYGTSSLYLGTTSGASTARMTARMHCDDTTYRTKCETSGLAILPNGSRLPVGSSSNLTYTVDASTSCSVTSGALIEATIKYYVESTAVRTDRFN